MTLAAIEPTTLEGRVVRLEPLTLEHHTDLCEIGLDEDLWRWTATRIQTPGELRDYLRTALELQSQGTVLPFVIRDKNTGRLAGSTRYGGIDRENCTVEIGWTWVGRPWQRTAVNTEAKYLLMRHAFEKMGCVRVSLKTDSLNERSRKAIMRIGAKEEGTLRNHMITWNGRRRHSVYYSVIEEEWPEVKKSLETKLQSV